MFVQRGCRNSKFSSNWSRAERLRWFLAYPCVEHRPTWIIGKLSEMLCLPTMSFIYKRQASSSASVYSPCGGRRRTAPHLHLSGREGADARQERKSWDTIRGQLPLAAPEPLNNQLVRGRERPQVVNRTCFPLLKCLIEQAGGGGDSIPLSQVQSAVCQTVGGQESNIRRWFWTCDGQKRCSTDRPFIKRWIPVICAWQAPLLRHLLLFPTSVFEIEHRPLRLHSGGWEYTALLSNWLSKG